MTDDEREDDILLAVAQTRLDRDTGIRHTLGDVLAASELSLEDLEDP